MLALSVCNTNYNETIPQHKINLHRFPQCHSNMQLRCSKQQLKIYSVVGKPQYHVCFPTWLLLTVQHVRLTPLHGVRYSNTVCSLQYCLITHSVSILYIENSLNTAYSVTIFSVFRK